MRESTAMIARVPIAMIIVGAVILVSGGEPDVNTLSVGAVLAELWIFRRESEASK